MQEFSDLKQSVHRECLAWAETRIAGIRHNIDEMRAAAQDSSKSSAGDKHETGRAMTDLEIEKQQLSLKNTLQMQAVLKQLDPTQSFNKVGTGTLLETDQGLFYIAVALGKIKVQDKELLVISAEAPIVKAFAQFSSEKTAVFNGRSYTLLRIT